MPDDALRRGGSGPRARDVVSFRPGVLVEGRPHVCVTLRGPRRVRVGYHLRDRGGHHLFFTNPDYPPEEYAPDGLRVVGVVEEFFESRPTVVGVGLAPLPEEGMLFEADAAGNIVELDDALIERCWGVEARECYGFGFINQVAPELRARFCAEWAEALARGGAVSLRTEALRVDGLRVPLVVLAVPARGGRGYSGVTQPGQIVRVA